jgi:hypothetical protein
MRNSRTTEPSKAIYLSVMVVFCGNRLVETTPKGFSSIFRFRPAAGGRVLCANASLLRMKATHLLDRRGYLHRLTPLSKRRAFLSWFAPVWDFTKMECAIETVGPLRVGELLTEAKNWKNDSGQKLRRFLAKQNPEAVFDQAMFRQAWEATYIALPESEWHKVFELRQ